jgi:hypothetical protein
LDTPAAGKVPEKERLPKDTRLEKRVTALYEETVSEPIPDDLLRFLDAAQRKN